MAVEFWRSNLVRNSLHKRIVTGIVLVAIITVAVISSDAVFLVLLLLINQLALMEYQNLIHHKTPSLQKIVMQLTGAILIIAVWLICKKILSVSILLLVPAIVPFFFSVELFRQKHNPFQNVALSLLGVAWISMSLSLFLFSVYLPFQSNGYHPFIALGYFTILWMSDTGAFLSGKVFGNHKLFERISPHKTWEGFAGGLLFAGFAGYLCFRLFSELNSSQWLLLSMVIYGTGTFGDFTKSMLKRSIGVKDSGTLLPGHGGVLDRFDTLVGSAPFAFLYLFFYA